MGNSQTKEAKAAAASQARVRSNGGSPTSPQSQPEPTQDPAPAESSRANLYTSRIRRGSRPDLSFLGIGGHGDDAASLEARRESKAEREARKLEKERVVRIKEREKSMKEEHVDGGYLVTQGVYVGIEDYNKAIVRQLMVRANSEKRKRTSPSS